MQTRHWISFVLPCVLAAPALAWQTDTCDGSVMGYRHPVTFRLDRCSIAAGGLREDAIKYAMNRWNAVAGMEDMFSWTAGNSDCRISEGDDVDEIGFVARSSIDADGLTHIIRNYCGLISNGATTETDVYLADDLRLGATAQEETDRIGARATALHEFGHVLGMDHENTGAFPRIMHEANIAGWVWGGTTTDDVHPNDVDFALTYHADSSQAQRPDLAVSTFESGTNFSFIGTFPGTAELCPGQAFVYTFSVGNLGGVSITSNKMAKIQSVISEDTTIGNADDRVVGNYTVWVHRNGTFTIEDTSFTVPTWLVANKTYVVGINADVTNLYSESNEGNNKIRLARRLKRKSGC